MGKKDATKKKDAGRLQVAEPLRNKPPALHRRNYTWLALHEGSGNCRNVFLHRRPVIRRQNQDAERLIAENLLAL